MLARRLCNSSACESDWVKTMTLPERTCPTCGIAVKKLDRHLRRIHHARGLSSSSEQSPAVVPTMVNQPVLQSGIDCSCLGANPNCFRCDGLGVYNARIQEARAPASQFANKKQNTKKKQNRISRQPAEEYQSSPPEAASMKPRQDVGIKVPIGPLTKLSSSTFYRCNLCRNGVFHQRSRSEVYGQYSTCDPNVVRVRPDQPGLKVSTKKRGPAHHNVVAVRKAKVESIQLSEGVQKVPSARVKCFACNEMVTPARLIRHTARAHPGFAPTPGFFIAYLAQLGHELPRRTHAKKRRTYMPASALPEDLGPSTSGAESWRGTSRDERLQDATRNYAHNLRDAGRYGSHAAHDDYGEDGNA